MVPLIDRGEAFRIFFDMGTSRTLRLLEDEIRKKYPDAVPSYDTLKSWSNLNGWQAKAAKMDLMVTDGLVEKLVPEWTKIKADLVDILLTQIKAADTKAITPKNARDLAFLITTLKDVIGEPALQKLEVTLPQIEYIPTSSPDILEAANILAVKINGQDTADPHLITGDLSGAVDDAHTDDQPAQDIEYSRTVPDITGRSRGFL